ncbi:UPF0462 protein C4orf33 homolog isoform X5 [Puma concolor]|uniref:UPF0462 protein C4orf33 homolog isoform X5 n=1 Tax=Puma concolor TaxID=9696 RepID=A0A6P6HPX3_PUMCO|nr:UPF0462 protein C4orf33 homolog isoform X5 [Puma concolor]
MNCGIMKYVLSLFSKVVEAFFLNDITEQYLEVELCPRSLLYHSECPEKRQNGKAKLIFLGVIFHQSWTIEFTAWENLPVLHRLVSLKFKSGIQGLLMEVNAFFDDLPTPPEYADQPRDGPWEYEDWGLDELMKPVIQYSMKKLRSDKCDLKPFPCVF